MQMKLQKQLLLGTNNPGKLPELGQLLAPLQNIALLSPAEVGVNIDVEESGSTYRENAALKARAFANASGLLTLADDSGLEVAVLDGDPGIHSARYSGVPDHSYADLRAYLLGKLSEHARPWTALFRATIAIAPPQGDVVYVEGICEGEIIPEERGSHGFGYDPIFYIPTQGCTMAELGDEQKNAISHRGNAARAAIPILLGMLENA